MKARNHVQEKSILIVIKKNLLSREKGAKEKNCAGKYSACRNK